MFVDYASHIFVLTWVTDTAPCFTVAKVKQTSVQAVRRSSACKVKISSFLPPSKKKQNRDYKKLLITRRQRTAVVTIMQHPSTSIWDGHTDELRAATPLYGRCDRAGDGTEIDARCLAVCDAIDSVYDPSATHGNVCDYGHTEKWSAACRASISSCVIGVDDAQDTFLTCKTDHAQMPVKIVHHGPPLGAPRQCMGVPS